MNINFRMSLVVFAVVVLVVMIFIFCVYSINQIKPREEYGYEFYNQPSDMLSFENSRVQAAQQ